ncbi:tumor necrosis factor receptor superfamily member 17 [Hyperolius riggenbachi]|uniref:tumor necrosis factor receptor superfamily member 17 n=1 Tax=Hyperolius riggenbachi TaxID=752182 RepID=UPI0035A38AAA
MPGDAQSAKVQAADRAERVARVGRGGRETPRKKPNTGENPGSSSQQCQHNMHMVCMQICKVDEEVEADSGSKKQLCGSKHNLPLEFLPDYLSCFMHHFSNRHLANPEEFVRVFIRDSEENPACGRSEYFDRLLQSCIPCHHRCPKLPPGCKKPCAGPESTEPTLLYKEVPPTSVGITHENKDTASPTIANDNYLIIWIVLALTVLTVTTVSFASIKLHRSRKKKACEGSHEKIVKNTKENSENSMEGMKSVSSNGLKIPVVENEGVEEPVITSSCDTALSDCLFPLPAVEEGAAILVTTKTSVSFNSGPGVRGDAFVEISQCSALEQENQ